jgi:hypothetical protein
MKTKFYLLFLGMIVVAACTTNKSSDEKQQRPLKYMVVENSKWVEDTLYYKIDYQYPFFKSDDSAVSQHLIRLNDRIRYFFDTAEKTFWGVDAEGAVKIIKESEASGKYESMNRYEILDTTNQLISLKFETYSYALGAHGFTAINTWNLNLGTGKLLKLTDVVDLSDKDKLTLFNQLLVAGFVNPEDCFTEEPRVDSDYNKFAISSDFLVIYFEAYELGAYSCGSAEILVSIDELKNNGLWMLSDE